MINVTKPHCLVGKKYNFKLLILVHSCVIKVGKHIEFRFYLRKSIVKKDERIMIVPNSYRPIQAKYISNHTYINFVKDKSKSSRFFLQQSIN